VSGRPADLPGAETMIGLFINTLPIRVHVDEDQPLLAWLQGLQAQQVSCSSTSTVLWCRSRDGAMCRVGSPFFETLMVFENYPVSSASLGGARGGSTSGTERDNGGGLEIRNVRSVEQTNYPITFVVGVDREMQLRIIYDTRRLSDASIVRMLGHLRTLLEGMVAPFKAAADCLVKDLPLLTAAEQRYLLVELNNTARPDPQYPCAHQWFEAQASQTPDAVAISFKASARASRPTRVTECPPNARRESRARPGHDLQGVERARQYPGRLSAPAGGWSRGSGRPVHGAFF